MKEEAEGNEEKDYEDKEIKANNVFILLIGNLVTNIIWLECCYNLYLSN